MSWEAASQSFTFLCLGAVICKMEIGDSSYLLGLRALSSQEGTPPVWRLLWASGWANFGAALWARHPGVTRGGSSRPRPGSICPARLCEAGAPRTHLA